MNSVLFRFSFLKKTESRTRWFYSFLGTVVFCLAAHGFVYLNLAPRHDMLKYIDTFAGEWEIQLGRFMQVAYASLMRGNYLSPWFQGIFSILLMGVACFLISELLNMKDPWVIFLSAGLMTTNISLVDLHYSFLYAADAFALAMLCACAGVFFVVRYPNLKGTVLASTCFVCTLGLYQSYILVAGVLLIFIVMRDSLRERMNCKIIRVWIWYVAAVLLTALLYFSLYKITLSAYDTVIPDQYNSGVVYNSPAFLKTFTFPLIRSFTKKAYLSFFGYFYGIGQESFTAVHLINAVFTIAMVVLLVERMISRKLPFVNVLLILAGIIVFPAVAQLMTILTRSNTTYFLTAHALFLVYPAMLALFSKCGFPKWPALRTIVLALCGCLIFFNIRFSNEMYTFQKMQYDMTFSHMTRVMDEIDRTPDYQYGETEVVMVGGMFGSIHSIEKPEGYQWLAGPSETGVNSLETFIAFVDLMGESMNITTDNVIMQEYQSMEQVAKMPGYPRNGYCQMIDGRLVVKLSN